MVSGECEIWQHRRLSSLWRDVGADIERCLTKSPENIALGRGLKRRASAFLTPELLCLFLHRVAHFLRANSLTRLAMVATRINFTLHKVCITPQSCIGPGCRLPHPAGVVFHGRAGRGLTLFGMAVCCARENGMEGPVENAPRLGDGVTVGAHAVVVGPIAVGNDTKISPFTILTKDAPSGVIVASRALRNTLSPSPPRHG